jgi:hypothetical protein
MPSQCLLRLDNPHGCAVVDDSRCLQTEVDADDVGGSTNRLRIGDLPLALDAERDEPAIRPAPDRRRQDPPLETAL